MRRLDAPVAAASWRHRRTFVEPPLQTADPDGAAFAAWCWVGMLVAVLLRLFLLL